MNDLTGSIIPLAPFILAQFSAVTDAEIGKWLLIATAICVSINQLLGVWQKLFPGKYEQEAKIARGRLHKRIDATGLRLEEKTQSLRLEVKEDIKGIHSRIDDVLTAVSELNGIIKRKKS